MTSKGLSSPFFRRVSTGVEGVVKAFKNGEERQGVRTEKTVGTVDHDQSVSRLAQGVRRLKSLSRLWSGRELGLLSPDAFAPPVQTEKAGRC